MEDEIIFLLICLIEILNKRMISLHYLVFIASRYLVKQYLLNSVKKSYSLQPKFMANRGEVIGVN